MAHPRLCLILIIAAFAAISATNSSSPDLVIEVFRHGARGPMNQTFDPEQNWGNNVGQLTPVGMRMHYLIGNALRHTYPNLLSSYDPATIYIRSTDVNRTIMSADSQLFGVFNGTGPGLGLDFNASGAVPAYQSQYIQEEISDLSDSYALPDNFQVVPVHVVTEPDDLVLLGMNDCPMTTNLSKTNGIDEEANYVFENYLTDIVDYLQSQGLQVETFLDLHYAGDNAVANKFQGWPLPGNVDPNSQYYKDLKFAMEYYTVKLFETTPTQEALNSVNLLSAISDYINGTVNGTSSLEFVFLSAHDTTLMTLLASFNITTKDCLLANYLSDKANGTMPFPNCTYPQFASNLIFEIYNTTDPYVIFYYNGLPVPFCGKDDNTCTLNELQAYIDQVTDDYSLADYQSMCGITGAITTPLNTGDNNSSMFVYILSGLCLALLISLVVTCMKLRNKDRGDSRTYSKQSLISEF